MNHFTLDINPESLEFSEDPALELKYDSEKSIAVLVIYWDGDERYYCNHWWKILCEGIVRIKNTKEHGEVKIRFAKSDDNGIHGRSSSNR